MNCPNCNRTVPDGSAFCSECGANIGDNKLSAAPRHRSISEVIKEKIKSPLFLVYTVFMSLAALFFIINVAAGGAISAMISIADAVCTAIPAVKCWMMYFSDESISAASIKLINVHNIAMIALTSLACIFSGLVSFLVIIACVLGGFLLSTMGEAENVISRAIDMLGLSSRISIDEILDVFKNGGVVIAIAGFAFAAVVLFVMINSVILYKNNNVHVGKIVSAFESERYEAKKYPVIRPWIFGIAFAVLGIFSFASSFSVALILISLAGTLITSTLWFASVHKDRDGIVKEKTEKAVKEARPAKAKKPKAEKVEKDEVAEPKVEEPVVEAPDAEQPAANEPVTEPEEEGSEPEKTEDAAPEVEPAAEESEAVEGDETAAEPESEAVEEESETAEAESDDSEITEAEAQKE